MIKFHKTPSMKDELDRDLGVITLDKLDCRFIAEISEAGNFPIYISNVRIGRDLDADSVSKEDD